MVGSGYWICYRKSRQETRVKGDLLLPKGRVTMRPDNDLLWDGEGIVGLGHVGRHPAGGSRGVRVPLRHHRPRTASTHGTHDLVVGET